MTKRKASPRRGRRTFSDAFRAEAVQFVREGRAAGRSLEQLARELDVGPDLLRTWVQRAARTAGEEAPNGGPASGASAPESAAAELVRLRREVAVLRQERDFLKKATAFFARESR
jgi:transposase